VKNAVPNIDVLKRAALRDKALTAMRDLASGAQFIDQVSARHVSIVIGIRPDLVKSLISAELDCTRASLRVRRKGRKGGNFRPADGIPTVDASLMSEPFFFEGGVVDLATDTWDFLRYPKVHRVVRKANLRPDLADVAWVVLRQTLRMGREISTMKSLWWGFVRAASVLDGFVDDLHRAELPAMQAAWAGYQGELERLRQALNLRAGDKITIVTHKLNENGAIAPRYVDYEVLASFLTKRYEFDNTLVFMPLQMLQEDLEYDRKAVSSIDLELADPAAAPKVADEIRKSLGRTDLKVADWQTLNARFVGALEVEKVMMFIILTLIVLVAAMNVVASFTMLVRVKRGSIAILRTMGASPATIVRAFFLAAAAVGLVGTALGTALGLLVCANMATVARLLATLLGAGGSGAGGSEIEFITAAPVRVQVGEVAAVIVIAVALSLGAAAYPAWRSARVEPVEGLRHE